MTFTPETAREAQRKGAETARTRREKTNAARDDLRARAALTPKERTRLATDELLEPAIANIREMLTSGSDRAEAVRAFFALWDRTHAKPPAQVELAVGPLGDLSAVPTSELIAQLDDMRRRVTIEAEPAEITETAVRLSSSVET